MGTTVCGDSELIRVTMIDYFSSVVLVDRLVYPDVPMLHFNTRFSGVTTRAMMEARKNRTCFFGRDDARKAIWGFVGPHTIVVGHSVNHDLTALRWRHGNVVDTHLLEEFVPLKRDPENRPEASAGELASPCSSSLTDTAAKVTPSTLPGRQEIQAGLQDMHLLAGALDNTTILNPTPANGLCSDITSEQNNCFKEDMHPVMAPRVQLLPGTGGYSMQGTAVAQTKKKSKGYGAMSLKTLTLLRLGRVIQDSKKTGHDSLEDAIATRDLARLVVLERAMQKQDEPQIYDGPSSLGQVMDRSGAHCMD